MEWAYCLDDPDENCSNVPGECADRCAGCEAPGDDLDDYFAPVGDGSGGDASHNCETFQDGDNDETHYYCNSQRRQIFANKEDCRAACLEDDTCDTIQWQGIRDSKYSYDDDKAQCFLITGGCTDLHPYNQNYFCMDIESVVRRR